MFILRIKPRKPADDVPRTVPCPHKVKWSCMYYLSCNHVLIHGSISMFSLCILLGVTLALSFLSCFRINSWTSLSLPIFPSTHALTDTHTHTHTCTHMHAHTRMHTHTHSLTHSFTQTHTHASKKTGKNGMREKVDKPLHLFCSALWWCVWITCAVHT